jgi:NAD(P)-dependent dehydrogenase (short-subunit alcohol dehydrogenase family)
VARVLVTGSSQGLGLMAARRLVEDGHAVTLHARDERRAADVRDALPLHEGVVVGDVSTLAGMRSVAEQADASGSFDAVVHNVGLGYREPRRE